MATYQDGELIDYPASSKYVDGKPSLKRGRAVIYNDGVDDLSITELNTDSNAISDAGGNETDATTGWTGVNLDIGANVFESQGVVKHSGSYAFHANCNDTPSNATAFYKANIGAAFSLIVGSRYKLSFYIRHVGSGGIWGFIHEGPYLVEVDSTDISFQLFEYEFTYDSSHNVFLFRENSDTNNGGVYVDNLSVVEI